MINIDYEILENSHKDRRIDEINKFCAYLDSKYNCMSFYDYDKQGIVVDCYDDKNIVFIIVEIQAVKNFIKYS